MHIHIVDKLANWRPYPTQEITGLTAQDSDVKFLCKPFCDSCQKIARRREFGKVEFGYNPDAPPIALMRQLFSPFPFRLVQTPVFESAYE